MSRPVNNLLALDPGNKETGIVLLEDGIIKHSGVYENHLILEAIRTHAYGHHTLAIEWINAMGMAVGKEVFETCMWVGRFAQASQCPVRLIPRGRVKHHHCGKMTAKDANVCLSLRDKYGDKGTKANPGYFYGVASHAWQAFAVAAYVMEGASNESEITITPA